MAVGDLTVKPVEDIYDAKRDPLKGSRNEQLNDDLPFDSRAGMTVAHYFPLDAEYVFKVRFRGVQSNGEEGETDPYQVRAAVKAGLHTVGVTSPRENLKRESDTPDGGRSGGRGGGVQIPSPVDLRLSGARLKRFDVPGTSPEVSKLIVGGLYNAVGRGDTPSRRTIFVCRPMQPADETACAQTILTTLAHRAFRRPATSAEAGKAYRISDVELASRLSFFLWSTIPDAGLADLAKRGGLKDPAALERQVRRMLDDPRADALVSNFAGQWLHLRNVDTVKPDPFLLPFDEALRQSFLTETALFVSSIFREDRSLLDLLSADYTFVNQRLAEHYGIPRVYGSQFRRVTLTDVNRRGLLGQGSVLTDGRAPIDASGKLPDGTEFQGPAGLSQLLLTQYRDDFVGTATAKLLTYALGRGVEYYDYPTIRSIGREAARENYRISSLILAIVKSTPFHMRRASES